MEVSISIVAIVISVVGLVIAYLSYKTSNDTRRETNQLRLVDKVIEYGLVVQKDMATLIQIRYETEAVKELTENISIEKTEKSKVTRHLSDILNNLDSIESGFRDAQEHLDNIINMLDDLSIGKEKNSVHRLFRLYVEVSQMATNLNAKTNDLEVQKLLINSCRASLLKHT